MRDDISYSLCNDVNCPRDSGIDPLREFKERSLPRKEHVYSSMITLIQKQKIKLEETFTKWN